MAHALLRRLLHQQLAPLQPLDYYYYYLYAANQESTDLIDEAHMEEEAPLRFMGQDAFYHQPLSLD